MYELVARHYLSLNVVDIWLVLFNIILVFCKFIDFHDIFNNYPGFLPFPKFCRF